MAIEACGAIGAPLRASYGDRNGTVCVRYERVFLNVQGGPKKRVHRLMTIIPSNLNRFNIFFTGRFLGKFAVKRI